LGRLGSAARARDPAKTAGARIADAARPLIITTSRRVVMRFMGCPRSLDTERCRYPNCIPWGKASAGARPAPAFTRGGETIRASASVDPDVSATVAAADAALFSLPPSS